MFVNKENKNCIFTPDNLHRLITTAAVHRAGRNVEPGQARTSSRAALSSELSTGVGLAYSIYDTWNRLWSFKS